MGVSGFTLYHNLLNWVRHILINLILIQSGRHALKYLCSCIIRLNIFKENAFNSDFLNLGIEDLVRREPEKMRQTLSYEVLTPGEGNFTLHVKSQREFEEKTKQRDRRSYY